jgi:hypothetical protein
VSQCDEQRALENLFLPFPNQARQQVIPGANGKTARDSNTSIPPSCPSEGNLYKYVVNVRGGGYRALALPEFDGIVPVSWKTRHDTLLDIKEEAQNQERGRTNPHAPNTAK